MGKDYQLDLIVGKPTCKRCLNRLAYPNIKEEYYKYIMGDDYTSVLFDVARAWYFITKQHNPIKISLVAHSELFAAGYCEFRGEHHAMSDAIDTSVPLLMATLPGIQGKITIDGWSRTYKHLYKYHRPCSFSG